MHQINDHIWSMKTPISDGRQYSIVKTRERGSARCEIRKVTKMQQRFNKLCHGMPFFSRMAVFLLFGVASLEPQTNSPYEEHTCYTMKCNRKPGSPRFFQRDKWDRVISNFSSSVVNTGFTLSAFKNEPLQLWSWNNFCRTHKPFFFKAVWFFRFDYLEFSRKMSYR